MLLNKKMSFIALLALLFSNIAIAQQGEPFLDFKFKHLSGLDILAFDYSDSDELVKFSQYDLKLFYPWNSENVNIGLGVTVRHLSGLKNNSLQSALPLLHASALYNFSSNGLSAGIEGNHAESTKNHLFDYKAKVSYEWRKGFGMQGGWQHQQFNLDKTATTFTDYELKGPYLDFYLNF